MSSALHAPSVFLQRAHLRARGCLLAWALAVALLGCALQFSPVLGLASPHPVVPPLLALASACVICFWILRSRALSPESLARDLDRDWTLAARLESSAELAHDASALAAAQRADAARHLAAHRPPLGGAWFSALALAAVAALLLLTEVSILGFRLLFPTAEASSPANPAAAADVSATLVWKTPEPEIKATAIEEIPLTALAATRTGLRSLSLEVAVNGRHRLSVPLDAASLQPFSKPGEHPVELSLYLDETGAQEFDLVSYHLRAERIPPQTSGLPAGAGLKSPPSSSPTLPPVASPLQFVQIRPAREDVARARMPPGPAGQILNLLTALKAAQLQLLKQNFLLAHAPIDHARTEWREENTRVASDQKTLAVKTAEARDFAIAEGLPALVVDNLGQSRPLMETAATKISAAENEPAAEPQGQALALIVATEKIIRKVIVESAATAAQAQPPSVRDPFKDSQQFKLPPRSSTPAGQLEQLADEQNTTAQNLSDPSASAQGPDKQAELARKLAELAASRSLDSSAQTKTEQAARDATEAAAQLRAGDREAARAPAAAAAEALRAATAAQEAAGRAAAEAELEQTRRDLNAAERGDDPTARSAALAEAAARLRAEAAAQQQTGSSAAARELAAAAAKVAAAARPSATGKGSDAAADTPAGAPQAPSPGGESAAAAPPAAPDSPGASGSSPGQSASDAATRAQAALASREQALSRALRQLARGSGRGGKGDGDGASPGGEKPSHTTDDALELDSRELEDLELGAQLGSALIRDPAALDLSRRIVRDIRHHSDQAGNVVRIPADLRDSVDRLVVLLEAARHAGLRDEQIRRYNPDDITPAYRPVVETYFEKLSREAK